MYQLFIMGGINYATIYSITINYVSWEKKTKYELLWNGDDGNDVINWVKSCLTIMRNISFLNIIQWFRFFKR